MQCLDTIKSLHILFMVHNRNVTSGTHLIHIQQRFPRWHSFCTVKPCCQMFQVFSSPFNSYFNKDSFADINSAQPMTLLPNVPSLFLALPSKSLLDFSLGPCNQCDIVRGSVSSLFSGLLSPAPLQWRRLIDHRRHSIPYSGWLRSTQTTSVQCTD